MAAIKTCLLVILAIFVYQSYCLEQFQFRGNGLSSKSDKSDKSNKSLTSNLIKAFRKTFLKKKDTMLGDILDNQLKEFITVKNIDTMTRDIVEITENVHEMTTLTTALAELSVLFDKVDHAYNLYLYYKDSNKNANDPSLHKFADETRSPYQGPIDYLNTIYSRVVPKDLDVSSDGLGYMNDVSVLSLLTKHMKTFQKMCNKSKSQQQILHMLYMSVGVAEMKLYSTLEFCFKKLAEIGECDFAEEIKLLKDQLYGRSNKAANMFEKFMHIASRDVWRCDPKSHIEDVTYTELKEVFQKYVVNDEDMNNENNCKKTCGEFKYGTVTNCANKEEHYDLEVEYYEYSICDQQRKCNGALFDCEDYFADYNELWICPSTLNSSRRYEFMEHGSVDPVIFKHDVRQYGPKGEKKKCNRHITYDYREFGQSFKDAWRHCEVCLCTCHDFKSPTSEQQINVRPVVADNDYVVTGARLVKKNHILHVQIEQGKILADGSIDDSTLHWKPIAEPRYVYDLRSFSWNGFRTIYLEVTEVPKNHVLVGLKLTNLNNGDGQMMSFKTLSVPYDYSTGELTYDGSYYDEPEKLDLRDLEFDPWPKYESSPISSEAEVSVENCDLPQNTQFPSLPQPDSKKTIKFTTSDFKKDLGQSMIPFIDIQEVTVRPAVPLAGIGFYHKGREGYGGFVGLKLVTFDHSPHIG